MGTGHGGAGRGGEKGSGAWELRLGPCSQQLSIQDRNRVLCDCSYIRNVLLGLLYPMEGAGSGGTTCGTVSGKLRT